MSEGVREGEGGGAWSDQKRPLPRAAKKLQFGAPRTSDGDVVMLA